MIRALRLLGVGFVMHVKMRATSGFDGLLAIIWPLFFALIAYFLFRAGGGSGGLVYAALGASVMGVWSATSTSAGSALQRERWHGTLELLAASPAHFSLILLPITITLSAIGIYSMVSTLLVGRFVFGVLLPLEQPFAFAAAVPVTILSIGTAGFLLAVAFVRYRAGWALGNMIEFPVWLIAGFLVPLTLLPGWVRPISWTLPPTWGMNAIREAAAGGTPWPDIGMCFVLAAAYTAVGIVLVEHMLRAARKKAALSLT
jgi:ABC-2 type transport system permease protein